jgi:CRISPR system Cascade subunit CasA
MSLNLISDAWIPVLDKSGVRRTIAPWQIADDTLDRPDWPRADLNLACLELLIGMVFLADPPADTRDWRSRRVPDPERLREKLARFAPAFNLVGDGPRFMQDFEPLEGEPNPPDMLFIDSAGGQTIRNNADLMVKRERYFAIELPLAAMALFTLQAHAPSGGQGNRTSMRGGGPMVTLVEPGAGLWQLVWANVPDGGPAKELTVLPWMRPTAISKDDHKVVPDNAHPTEALFGMPRRLRLVEESNRIVGAIQRPYGANYAGWEHPLSPHYRMKEGAELLPVHPKAGLFGYRHWLGVVAVADKDNKDLRHWAGVVNAWHDRSGGQPAQVIVAGWAMKKAKPRDFTWSTPPLVDLAGESALLMQGLVRAAEEVGVALRNALEPVLAAGEAREPARETFFLETQTEFEAHLAQLQAGKPSSEVAKSWLAAMRRAALELFDDAALPGLDQRDSKTMRGIVEARGRLVGAFSGYGTYGQKVFAELMLEPPEQKKSGRKREKTP